MWKDSLARAAKEQKAWPYAWAEAPGYEHAEQRGQRQRPAADPGPTSSKHHRGRCLGRLAAPPYPVEFAKAATITIDWQTDGKHYQYWARADATGRFTIPNARPGTLYALCVHRWRAG